jgi:hypothetical protein
MDSIARRRLLAQRLSAPAFRTPEAVVAWLGAMQAQDYRGALWAVGIRMASATEALVERALAARAIVRTWPLRGTLHFIAATDVHWMLDLLATRTLARNTPRMKRDYDLGDAVLAKAERVVVRALQGGKQLQRDALYQVLDDAGIDSANQRGLHVVFALAHRKVICFGTREEKQHTFRLLDEWVPAGPAWTREEQMAELATRYFTSHGPATLQDFTWWSGLTAADAREALALAEGRLEQEEIGDKRYWFKEPVRAKADPALRSWLLPAFDEFTVAYKDRSAVVDPAHRRLHVGLNGLINPAIVLDGRVEGTWKRKLTPAQAVIAMAPFTKFSRAEHAALLPAIRRYGQFLGVPAVPAAR